MNSKCLEKMDIEEFCKNHPPLTDYQKEKYDELYNRGWFDVAQVYWDSCKKRNYAEYIVRRQPRGIYRNAEPMTKEQREKHDELIEMGWRDVAMVYMHACQEENYTESYKMRLQYGWFEGVGMDPDEL